MSTREDLTDFSALERRLAHRREQDRLVTDQERALRGVRRELRAGNAVYQLTSTLNESNSTDEFCEAALNALEEAVQAKRASILLCDSTGSMRFRSWRGLSEAYRRAVEGHSPWSPQERDPQPILISNVEDEPAMAPYRPLFHREGIQSLGFFPLVGKGTLLGKFMVYYEAPHIFGDEEIQICQTIAHQIAIALERTRTEEGLREALQSLERTKAQLEEQIREFEKFEEVVVDRELKMIALEKELAKLQALHPPVKKSGSPAL